MIRPEDSPFLGALLENTAMISSVKLTEESRQAAYAYFAKMRSKLKRAYAWNYFGHMVHGHTRPERGELSYMAAQAVRSHLDTILGITEYQAYGLDCNGQLTWAGPIKFQGAPTQEMMQAEQDQWEEWARSYCSVNGHDIPLAKSIGKTTRVCVHPIGEDDKFLDFPIVQKAGAMFGKVFVEFAQNSA